MTKLEYLGKLEGIVDTIELLTKKAGSISTSDAIQMLRLQFDITTAIYNCTKEEEK
jgi:hypothetical protein